MLKGQTGTKVSVSLFFSLSVSVSVFVSVSVGLYCGREGQVWWEVLGEAW
jgi:hypothetical protein